MKWLAALVFLIPLLLYSPPVFRSDYVALDDELLIVDNVKARGVTWENVKQAFTTYDPELYIPLTLLTEQIEYSIVGEWNPAVSHGISLVLHALNAVLVFWLVMLLLQRFPSFAPLSGATAGRQIPDVRFQEDSKFQFSSFNSQFAALGAALLWAVHPLNVEAVAWASARKDLLSGFFFLFSLILYLCSRNEQRANTQRTVGALYIGSIITFFFGLLAKVSIAPLPLVLLLLEWFLPSRPLPAARPDAVGRGEGQPTPRLWPASRVRGLRSLLPFFLLSILFVGIALFGKKAQVHALGATILAPFLAIPFYLQKLFIPLGLSVLYPFTEDLTVGHPSMLFGMAVVVAITVSVLWGRRWSRIPLIAWTMFLLLLAPSFLSVAKSSDSGIVDLYIASDRYMYLALLVPIILASYSLFLSPRLSAVALAKVEERAGVRGLLCGTIGFIGLLGFFCFLSYRQVRVWRSSEALFRNVLLQHQASHIAANNLAGFLARKGKTTEAIELYRQSLTIRENPRALFNLGQLLVHEKRFPEALPLFQNYVAMRPRDAFGRMQLGGLHLMEGRAAEARLHLAQAVASDPSLIEAHYLLGVALERLGDRAGAREEFQETLRLDPVHRYAKEKLGGSSLPWGES